MSDVTKDGYGLETAIGPVGKWQLRIRSEEPTLIENTEVVFERTLRPVMDRMYTMVKRTCYMVNGPNREVMWAIDRWNYRAERWNNICQGKSRLPKQGHRKDNHNGLSGLCGRLERLERLAEDTHNGKV